MRLITSMVLVATLACASIEFPDGTEVSVFGQSSAEFCQSSGGEVEVAPGRIHVVQSGENLFRIGMLYGMPPQTLQDVNEIEDVTKLTVGQELLIPASLPATSGTCFVVKGGQLSEGMTRVLSDSLKIPGALIRGAAAGLP